MKISVSGKQVKVGTALQEYVEAELERAVSKYFDRAIGADVVFTKERHLFKADIIVNEGTGAHIIIKSSGQSEDAHAAFDEACEKIEKQLRRYKRKIKNHHNNGAKKDINVIAARKYVLASQQDDEVEESSGNNDTPLVIAEKQTDIEHLTVGEAVMRMDMLDVSTLVFVNRLNGVVGVIYKRNDGNISWVDTGISSS